MELEWCTDKGIPHSEFLSWSPEDRAKVLASLLESRKRCPSCGTSDWEWEEDRGAYQAMQHVCQGCKVLYAAEEETDTALGARMILVPKRRATEIMAAPKRLNRRRR
jgi:hypothetical protein